MNATITTALVALALAATAAAAEDVATTTSTRAKGLELAQEYTVYVNKQSPWEPWVEGFKIKGRSGWTNHDGNRDVADGTRSDLDRTVFDYGIDFGYYGRKVVRDIVLRQSEEHRVGYAVWKAGKENSRDNILYWGLIDAIKLDLRMGYGTTIDDTPGDNNSRTDTKGVYTAKLSWEIPLDRFSGKNPFD